MDWRDGGGRGGEGEVRGKGEGMERRGREREGITSTYEHGDAEGTQNVCCD